MDVITVATVNALPSLCSSGRLQSPPFQFGDGSQSASGEEQRHLMSLRGHTPEAILSTAGRFAASPHLPWYG
jgi:hypothetical protein